MHSRSATGETVRTLLKVTMSFANYSDNDLLDLMSFLIKAKFTSDDWEALFCPSLKRLMVELLDEAGRPNRTGQVIERVKSLAEISAKDDQIDDIFGCLGDMVRFERTNSSYNDLLEAFETAIWPYVLSPVQQTQVVEQIREMEAKAK